MQRVSGLYGNGVLTDDPTDRAAAANQRMATDVWSAKQGYEWGREGREQAKQDALERLALMREQMGLSREQMGLQADLTREGWARGDKATQSQFDYLNSRDERMRQAMLEDRAYQDTQNAPMREAHLAQMRAAMEMFGLQSQKAKADLERTTKAGASLQPVLPVAGMTPEEQAAYTAAVAAGADPYTASAPILAGKREDILSANVGTSAREDLADADTQRNWLNRAYQGIMGNEGGFGATDPAAAREVAQPYIDRGFAMLRQLKDTGMPKEQAKRLVQQRIQEMLGQPTEDNKGAHRLVYQALGL